MKRNQGYTLVELLVSIAVGSLVTLAATTVLLLGLRIHNRSTATVIRQNTARVVLTMLENLAAEGDITSIEVAENGEADAPKSWRIRNAKNVILASFDADKAAIYAGSPYLNPDGNGEPVAATPILENVSDSTIRLAENGVLTVSVTTEDDTYTTSVYCRTMAKQKQSEPDVKDTLPPQNTPTPEGRKKFLNVLASQYRLVGGSPNPGLILDNGYSTGVYYTQWYLGGTYNIDGWNAETPWCACFVSWALCEVSEKINSHIDPPANSSLPKGVAFASVDNFWNYFKNLGGNGEHWKNASYVPTPGDIIFIDWSGAKADPAHVGVVLKVETDAGGLLKTVYTIEGNMENRVMIRRYAVGENYDVVMGYGIIDWTG